MSDDSITEESPVDIGKAAKWTIFMLVDLRVLFIITYVYVSVVNLISTTANGEASEDIHSTGPFTVTSHPDHVDVNVSFIDDAILWSCRDHSVTKRYYRGLYWMLISAFSATMVTFLLTKITIIFGAKHGSLYLWQLAVIECLQQLGMENNDKAGETKKVDKYFEKENKKQNKGFNEGNPISKLCSDNFVKIIKKLMNEQHPLRKVCHDEKVDEKDKKYLKCYNYCRVISLFFSVAILVAGIVLTILFYDLHPLSCIYGQREKYYDYDETNESVRIHFSNGILVIQKVVGAILPVLALAFVINAFSFYYFNTQIIKIFAKYMIKEFPSKRFTEEPDHSNSQKNCCICCSHISKLKHCLCYFICQ